MGVQESKENYSYFQDIDYIDRTEELDIPMSVGIENNNGIMAIIIPKGSTLPISKEHFFLAPSDINYSPIIKLYKGEQKMEKDNFFLGKLKLSEVFRGKKIKVIVNITIKYKIQLIVLEMKTQKSVLMEMNYD